MDLSDYVLERLRKDSEFVLYRAKPGGGCPGVLLVASDAQAGEQSKAVRLAHEVALFKDFEPDWAIKPLSLTHYEGRLWLALRDPGGQPLDLILAGKPLELDGFSKSRLASLPPRANCMHRD